MKLNYKRTILIGLAFLSVSAFWQMYDNVIPLILKNSFGLGETVTGAVMAIDNVLALFLLPVFGMLSDKIMTPIGGCIYSISYFYNEYGKTWGFKTGCKEKHFGKF